MGINPRSRSDRRHTHTEAQAAVPVQPEGFLYELLEKSDQPAFLLILDGIQDPHNLGACIRSADGAGVQAVIVPKDRSATLTDVVRQVACGGAENVPIIEVTNLARCMKKLKDLNIWLAGTADEADKPFYEIDLKGPMAIVMGSEGKGLRRLTRDTCDFLGKIPMHGSVSSLNVSVATGICLFEALRQRNSDGHK